jgi:hypothetical protein
MTLIREKISESKPNIKSWPPEVGQTRIGRCGQMLCDSWEYKWARPTCSKGGHQTKNLVVIRYADFFIVDLKAPQQEQESYRSASESMERNVEYRREVIGRRTFGRDMRGSPSDPTLARGISEGHSSASTALDHGARAKAARSQESRSHRARDEGSIGSRRCEVANFFPG